MSLNQQVIAEFSPCTPCAPQLRDLSIQTFHSSGLLQLNVPNGIPNSSVQVFFGRPNEYVSDQIPR